MSSSGVGFERLKKRCGGTDILSLSIGLELDEQITPWVQNPFNGTSTVGQIIEAIGMNITVSGGTSEENRPRTSDETRAVPLSGLLILETLRAVSYPINILRLEPLVRYR